MNVGSRPIQRSDDGKVFVRDGGWPIPSLASAENDEFEYSVIFADGRKVEVNGKLFRLDLSVIMDNPLSAIGWADGKIRINKVKEYRTAAGMFCYKFLVNQADVDESTNRIRSTRGVLFSYSYYDEDGDGVFESLFLDETDRRGRQGFESEPHLPKWLLGKE